MYWAEALAKQTTNAELQSKFADVAKKLADNEEKIVQELNEAQGEAMDIGGYFLPDDEKSGKAMRPSATLNTIIDAI